MSPARFYQILEENKDKANWTCEGSIRGTLKHTNQYTKDCVFCPITFVDYIEKNSYHRPSHVNYSVVNLKLNSRFVSSVIRGSDWMSNRSRDRLKKILGI